MNLRNDAHRYGSLSIGFHWLMLLLIAAVYTCIELREIYPRGSDPREALKTWHFMLGLSVLALVSLRVIVHLTGPVPGIVPAPPRWQTLAARTMHLALYLLMFAMPIAGWMILSAEGEAIPFFGLELPPLINENKVLAETIEDLHKTAGKTGYFLIGIHAAAGLFHHYFLRDNTLRRMLPFSPRP